MVEGNNLIILRRKKPISNVPNIVFGSMQNDGGNFIFNETEKEEFLKNEPDAKQWIKPLLSAKEFLNNEKRYCLWLVNIKPPELKQLKSISQRVENVNKLRLESNRESTGKLANFPAIFGENRQPETDYLLLHSVSSEKRKYIPMVFFTSKNIANNSCLIIPHATLYLFIWYSHIRNAHDMGKICLWKVKK